MSAGIIDVWAMSAGIIDVWAMSLLHAICLVKTDSSLHERRFFCSPCPSFRVSSTDEPRSKQLAHCVGCHCVAIERELRRNKNLVNSANETIGIVCTRNILKYIRFCRARLEVHEPVDSDPARFPKSSLVIVQLTL